VRTFLIKCKNCQIDWNSSRNSFHKYCSVKCQKDFEFKQNIKNWLNGKTNPLNTNGVIKPFVRKYLFILNNNKCCLCGWGKINQTTDKIPLEVDHINGDYRDNRINNLRLLCPNCHSLTSNYKSLNKGKGRNKKERGLR
jgi:hypothetical protein